MYIDYKKVIKSKPDGVEYRGLTDEDVTLCGTSACCFYDDIDSEEFKDIEKEFGIKFFESHEIEFDFYCVPLVDVFAYDENGYYGAIGGDAQDEEATIVYIDKNLKAYNICKSIQVFLKALLDKSFVKKLNKINNEVIIISI